MDSNERESKINVRMNRVVCSTKITNQIRYNFILKLTFKMFLEYKPEAGCIRGHLLPEDSRPNFIVLILEDLSPDLSSFRHKKSWGNFWHIHITDFHIFIIIYIWLSTSLAFFFTLEVQLLHL